MLPMALTPATAMKYHNVVKPPLVTDRDDQKILGDLFYFPEHHVFTGIVGKLANELGIY